jgi:hypothetical protein
MTFIAVIWNVIQTLLGGRTSFNGLFRWLKNVYSSTGQKGENVQQDEDYDGDEQDANREKKKVFGDDEGEYVDYEETKDEKKN